jgi:hypothetical protein
MDGQAGFFRVHLQSLKDFAERLQEQLHAVQRPGHAYEVLRQRPGLPLGSFAEAFSLSDEHSDAVGQFAIVLDRVARSLDFATSVTTLVAQRYEALNTGGAQAIGSVAGPMGGTMPPVTGMAAVPPAAIPVTGTAAPPPGSVATPDVIARLTVPVPPAGGTVYYYNGSTTVPVRVTVQAADA